MRGFAILAGTEAIARGILISVFPLALCLALGDASAVSQACFRVGVVSLISGLMVPFVTRFAPRRWIYSGGAAMFSAGALIATQGSGPAVVTGLVFIATATVICFVCFNAYVPDYIAKIELGRCETSRMFYSAFGWTIGPVLRLVGLHRLPADLRHRIWPGRPPGRDRPVDQQRLPVPDALHAALDAGAVDPPGGAHRVRAVGAFVRGGGRGVGPALPDGGQAVRADRDVGDLFQLPRRVGHPHARCCLAGAAWLVLLAAPLSGIFVAGGAGLLAMWALSERLHPRLGQARPVRMQSGPILPRREVLGETPAE